MNNCAKVRRHFVQGAVHRLECASRKSGYCVSAEDFVRCDNPTHVQRQYKNPAKQNAAIPIRMTNSENIARNANTIKLFDTVTNASLVIVQLYLQWDMKRSPRE